MVPEHPGVTLRSQEVRRSEKKRKKKFRKIRISRIFDPDFRICFHGVANKATRATCSQNFRPLAAVVPEIFRSLTIIKYRIKINHSDIYPPSQSFVQLVTVIFQLMGLILEGRRPRNGRGGGRRRSSSSSNSARSGN